MRDLLSTVVYQSEHGGPVTVLLLLLLAFNFGVIFAEVYFFCKFCEFCDKGIENDKQDA